MNILNPNEEGVVMSVDGERDSENKNLLIVNFEFTGVAINKEDIDENIIKISIKGSPENIFLLLSAEDIVYILTRGVEEKIKGILGLG